MARSPTQHRLGRTLRVTATRCKRTRPPTRRCVAAIDASSFDDAASFSRARQ
jgi:hypothetical protein